MKHTSLTAAVPLLFLAFAAACASKPQEGPRSADAATPASSAPARPPAVPAAAGPSPSPAATPKPTAAVAPAPRPSAPPTSAPPQPKPAATSAPAPRPAAAAPPPPPPKRERIAIVNSCNKPVRLFLKRAGADLQTSLNTSTRAEEPATDGDTVQVMDDTGRNVLDQMVIAPTMKEIVIQSGCAKLESR